MLSFSILTVALGNVATVGAHGANAVASNGALDMPAHNLFACIDVLRAAGCSTAAWYKASTVVTAPGTHHHVTFRGGIGHQPSPNITVGAHNSTCDDRLRAGSCSVRAVMRLAAFRKRGGLSR